MTATVSLKLFDITQEFIQDKDKAREFVSKIEETIDDKFNSEKTILASKIDIAELESKISKTIYIVGLIQFLGIIGSVIAIVNFMIK